MRQHNAFWLTLMTAAAFFGLVTNRIAAGENAVKDVPGPLTRVESILGTPTFTVDGKPFTIPCFETYHPEEHYFKQFAEQGVKLFSFNTNALACDYGHSKPISPEMDLWDYSQLEERLDHVLAADPEAMIIPRINLGTPRWWLEKNPGELEVLDHGSTLYKDPNPNPTLPKGRPFPSLASEKWRQDTGEALRRLILHLQKSKYGKHIFGYMLAGLDTEEWYHWSSGSNQLMGYSEPTRRAFRRWLERKYGTDQRLAEVWNKPDVRLATAEIPSRTERIDATSGSLRDPSKAMNVIDFYLFYNQLIPETIDCFASVARQATAGRKVIGAFYGYMYEFRGDPEYGHNALEQYNNSANLDFIFVTASYENRAFATGADYARSPAMSVRLHGKLWYHDNDVVSFLAREVMARRGLNEQGAWNTSAEHHLNVLGYTDTAQRTRWMYRRSMGFALCNGAYESYFDLHGGYYDHPELMEEVGLLNRVAEASATADRTPVSQILIVSDEASCSYATYQSWLLNLTLLASQHQFVKMGVPADHVLACDLPLVDPSSYKLVVFLNCWNMNQATRQLIQEKFKKQGRWLLWCYAPGYFDGPTASAEAMSQLAGMRLAAPADHTLYPPKIELLDGGARLIGMKSGAQVGDDYPCAEAFRVEDPHALPLAKMTTTGQTVFARRNHQDWTALYLWAPVLPAAAWRELARNAGVHIWNERDDSFYANRSYFCLHANGAGPRQIRLPQATTHVTDALSSESLKIENQAIQLELDNGETKILRWSCATSHAELSQR